VSPKLLKKKSGLIGDYSSSASGGTSGLKPFGQACWLLGPLLQPKKVQTDSSPLQRTDETRNGTICLVPSVGSSNVQSRELNALGAAAAAAHDDKLVATGKSVTLLLIPPLHGVDGHAHVPREF
jgi:hypothetical protein